MRDSNVKAVPLARPDAQDSGIYRAFDCRPILRHKIFRRDPKLDHPDIAPTPLHHVIRIGLKQQDLVFATSDLPLNVSADPEHLVSTELSPTGATALHFDILAYLQRDTFIGLSRSGHHIPIGFTRCIPQYRSSTTITE